MSRTGFSDDFAPGGSRAKKKVVPVSHGTQWGVGTRFRAVRVLAKKLRFFASFVVNGLNLLWGEDFFWGVKQMQGQP